MASSSAYRAAKHTPAPKPEREPLVPCVNRDHLTVVEVKKALIPVEDKETGERKWILIGLRAEMANGDRYLYSIHGTWSATTHEGKVSGMSPQEFARQMPRVAPIVMRAVAAGTT
jgi:hypothetical protein